MLTRTFIHFLIGTKARLDPNKGQRERERMKKIATKKGREKSIKIDGNDCLNMNELITVPLECMDSGRYFAHYAQQ